MACRGNEPPLKHKPQLAPAGDPADLAATKAFFTAFAKATDAVGIPVRRACKQTEQLTCMACSPGA